MTEILALKVNEKDNIATVFAENLSGGVVVTVRDHRGIAFSLKLTGGIPYGHKVAISPIKKGAPIMKYGEEIGRSTRDIAPGEHVHVHNMDSMRGRGDLYKGEEKIGR